MGGGGLNKGKNEDGIREQNAISFPTICTWVKKSIIKIKSER